MPPIQSPNIHSTRIHETTQDGGFVYDTVSSGPNIGLIVRF